MKLTRVKIKSSDSLNAEATFDAASDIDAMTQAVKHIKKNSPYEIICSNYVLEQNKIIAKARQKNKTGPDLDDSILTIEFSVCSKAVVTRTVEKAY